MNKSLLHQKCSPHSLRLSEFKNCLSIFFTKKSKRLLYILYYHVCLINEQIKQQIKNTEFTSIQIEVLGERLRITRHQSINSAQLLRLIVFRCRGRMWKIIDWCCSYSINNRYYNFPCMVLFSGIRPLIVYTRRIILQSEVFFILISPCWDKYFF